jgi:CDP-diacylglycerol--glycerol-3-phosphate 3-phosphatidyltransferase
VGVFQHWPNRITTLRLVGAALLFALLALRGQQEASSIRGLIHVSFWLFIVTAATDVLDGYLARRGNHVSAFGRIADPFCDKVLTLGSMVFLSVLPWDPAGRSLFPAWILVVILAREFLVTGIRGYAESLGVDFSADLFGKLKMVVQCIAIGALLFMYAFEWTPEVYDRWWLFGRVLVYATLATTVLSGLNYLLKSRHVLARSGA